MNQHATQPAPAKPQHTPGAWRWCDGRLIQTSHITRDVWEIPRNQADMDLIAAAPDLLTELQDKARQLESMASRLSAEVGPGHVDYINKSDAASWASTLSAELRAAIAKAGGNMLDGAIANAKDQP